MFHISEPSQHTYRHTYRHTNTHSLFSPTTRLRNASEWRVLEAVDGQACSQRRPPLTCTQQILPTPKPKDRSAQCSPFLPFSSLSEHVFLLKPLKDYNSVHVLAHTVPTTSFGSLQYIGVFLYAGSFGSGATLKLCLTTPLSLYLDPNMQSSHEMVTDVWMSK